MTCANLCVDINKGHGFWRGTKLGLPFYFVVDPYNCSTNVLAVWCRNSQPFGAEKASSPWAIGLAWTTSRRSPRCWRSAWPTLPDSRSSADPRPAWAAPRSRRRAECRPGRGWTRTCCRRRPWVRTACDDATHPPTGYPRPSSRRSAPADSWPLGNCLGCRCCRPIWRDHLKSQGTKLATYKNCWWLIAISD